MAEARFIPKGSKTAPLSSSSSSIASASLKGRPQDPYYGRIQHLVDRARFGGSLIDEPVMQADVAESIATNDHVKDQTFEPVASSVRLPSSTIKTRSKTYVEGLKATILDAMGATQYGTGLYDTARSTATQMFEVEEEQKEASPIATQQPQAPQVYNDMAEQVQSYVGNDNSGQTSKSSHRDQVLSSIGKTLDTLIETQKSNTQSMEQRQTVSPSRNKDQVFLDSNNEEPSFIRRSAGPSSSLRSSHVRRDKRRSGPMRSRPRQHVRRDRNLVPLAEFQMNDIQKQLETVIKLWKNLALSSSSRPRRVKSLAKPFTLSGGGAKLPPHARPTPTNLEVLEGNLGEMEEIVDRVLHGLYVTEGTTRKSPKFADMISNLNQMADAFEKPLTKEEHFSKVIGRNGSISKVLQQSRGRTKQDLAAPVQEPKTPSFPESQEPECVSNAQVEEHSYRHSSSLSDPVSISASSGIERLSNGSENGGLGPEEMRQGTSGDPPFLLDDYDDIRQFLGLPKPQELETVGPRLDLSPVLDEFEHEYADNQEEVEAENEDILNMSMSLSHGSGGETQGLADTGEVTTTSSQFHTGRSSVRSMTENQPLSITMTPRPDVTAAGRRQIFFVPSSSSASDNLEICTTSEKDGRRDNDWGQDVVHQLNPPSRHNNRFDSTDRQSSVEAEPVDTSLPINTEGVTYGDARLDYEIDSSADDTGSQHHLVAQDQVEVVVEGQEQEEGEEQGVDQEGEEGQEEETALNPLDGNNAQSMKDGTEGDDDDWAGKNYVHF